MHFDFLFWVFTLVTLLYVIIMATASFLWKRKTLVKKEGKFFPVQISVVVAARNEEKNIFNCLKAIADQNYPAEQYEIIVINDNSSDSTVRIVEDFADLHCESLKLIHLNAPEGTYAFKKKAIEKGIEHAKGDLIVTTDADCVMGPDWLSSIAFFYARHQFRMIAGPVLIAPASTLFEGFQNLEFSALIGMGGAFLQSGFPVMCNGANLIYEKEAFFEAGGFSSIENKASGDDMLLMLKFKKHFGPNAIGFLKSEDAVVYTKPVPSLALFYQQRKRWASKSGEYRDLAVITLAVIVFLTSFSLTLCLFMSLISGKFALLFIVLLLVKSLFDFIFLFTLSSFFKNRKWLWLSFPGQFFNIFYVPLIAIASRFGSYAWKGRRLS
jgi:cellulose synthase/poly-beta-1,6-N-acetylglucosamine synthase-like glycosyltransferase